MSLSFSRIVSDDPYIVELIHGTNLVHVHARWFDGSDDSKCRMETAVQRFPDAKSFGYWLEWFDLSLLKTLAGEATSTVTAAAYPPGLTALDRRLLSEMMRHPQRASFKELREAWDKDVQEDAIIQALKRLRKRLPRAQWGFEISKSNWEIVWVKKGQNIP